MRLNVNIFKITAFLAFIFCLSIFVAPSAVLAKDTVPFTIITSTTDDFQTANEYSITFAEELTINGETLKGAKVNIFVTYDEALKLEPNVYDEITIGATCKLIQPIELKLGDNIVEIKVSKDGYETNKATYIIKRKDGAVLQSLQNLIVIPSQ